MLFTSVEFLMFAAALLVLYYVVPRKCQWPLLLAASYIFYGLADVKYLIYIAVVTLTSYLTALRMGEMSRNENAYVESTRGSMSKEERKAYRAAEKKKRRRVLILGLVAGFGILAVIKYTAFAVVNINSVLHLFGSSGLTVPRLLLPMGISFYTFQAMGYLIDVYRGKTEAERNPAKYALFVAYFPQLIQGPISRFGDLAGQLTAPHAPDAEGICRGLIRVLWGYFKKLVVADRMLVAVKALTDKPEEHRGVYALLLILFYSVEIYADFTGGIDITIGLSEALGIRLAENFRHPFFSKSTKEYWRRWHITMGTWFSDYIFYPLSVSAPMQKLSKWGRAHLGTGLGKRLPVYLATLVTWFMTGLWHGAGWNFIVWGLLNAVIILVSQELSPLYERFHAAAPRLCASGGYGVFMMARTFLLMGTVRVLDCYRDVPLTFRMVGSIFTTPNWSALFDGSVASLGLGAADYILVALCCVLMVAVSAYGEKKDLRRELAAHPAAFCAVAATLVFVIVIFGAWGVGYDANQFIYNQF